MVRRALFYNSDSSAMRRPRSIRFPRIPTGLRRHCTRDSAIRQTIHRQDAACLQQDAARHSSPLGRSQQATVRMGSGLLPAEERTGHGSRRGVAMSRPAVAQDPLEDVADSHAVQRITAHSEPGQSRLLGHRLGACGQPIADVARIRSESEQHGAKNFNFVLYSTENISCGDARVTSPALAVGSFSSFPLSQIGRAHV